MSDEMNLELNDVLTIDEKASERVLDAFQKAVKTCQDADSKRLKLSVYVYALDAYRQAKRDIESCHSRLINDLQELHEAGLIPNEHQ